jgi:DNA transformation protein
MKLSEMPNTGAVVEAQLIEVGITTREELIKAGSKEAWLRIYAIDPSACIHRLYGIEGAIRGIRKTMLDEETKADLRAFVKQIKG